MRWLIGFVCGACLWVSYMSGQNDGRNDVINACRLYGQYMIRDSAYKITCEGPFDWDALIPPYKPYSKELKDAHKRERK